ncbi:unnamed protein product [Nippostrongylus brasiliensis]|uniref:Transmembrane protein n=1 Tax=Nippostrongylus brasiliensis TaxID=27835 RepID=A0A0N4XT61_NIPBR|nr:unnamed protein product [Nippostrongylus brasiliensis]
MLGVAHFIQARGGVRSSELHKSSTAVSDWISQDGSGTPGHRSTIGRPPLRWSAIFVKPLNERLGALRVPRESKTVWWGMTATEANGPIEQIGNQRDDRLLTRKLIGLFYALLFLLVRCLFSNIVFAGGAVNNQTVGLSISDKAPTALTGREVTKGIRVHQFLADLSAE